MRRSTGWTGPSGSNRLRVWHLNDSRRERGSRVDRHAGIGAGQMGLEPFRHLVNDPRFRDLPMILETPKGIEDGEDLDARNLRVLRQLVRPARSSRKPRLILRNRRFIEPSASRPDAVRADRRRDGETAAKRVVMSTTQLNGQAVTSAGGGHRRRRRSTRACSSTAS